MVQTSKFSVLMSVVIPNYNNLAIFSTWKFQLSVFVDRNLFTPFCCVMTLNLMFSRGHYWPSFWQTPFWLHGLFWSSLLLSRASAIHRDNRATAVMASFASGSFLYASQRRFWLQPMQLSKQLIDTKLPPRHKAHSGDLLVPAAPSEPCSGLLSPKSGRRHCVGR